MPPSDAEELFKTKAKYEVFEALNPFFGVVLKGLRGLVDGKHYFDTFAEDDSSNLAITFPAGLRRYEDAPICANLVASFTGYGKTIKLRSGDALVVHRSRDHR